MISLKASSWVKPISAKSIVQLLQSVSPLRKQRL